MTDLPEHLRAFIAVRIPDEVRAQLAEVQQQLRPALRDVSWTRPEAMHLTLQFLGNIDSARVPGLAAALGPAGVAQDPFEIALGDVGSFGNRVIWIGLERGAEPMQKLAAAVRRAAQDFASHEENRAFNAHVTLGRVRRPARGLAEALRKVRPPKFHPWTAAAFELIRSELSPHGARYTTLAEIHLQ